MNDYLIGLAGRIVTRIPGGANPGELQVEYRGMTHKFVAYAETEVLPGTEAWIIATRGGNAVDVRAA